MIDDQPYHDNHFEQAILPKRIQLANQIQVALDGINVGEKALKDLRGGLFDIEYVEGNAGDDVEEHLAAAAHELRAALRVAKPLSDQP